MFYFASRILLDLLAFKNYCNVLAYLSMQSTRKIKTQKQKTWNIVLQNVFFAAKKLVIKNPKKVSPKKSKASWVICSRLWQIMSRRYCWEVQPERNQKVSRDRHTQAQGASTWSTALHREKCTHTQEIQFTPFMHCKVLRGFYILSFTELLL